MLKLIKSICLKMSFKHLVAAAANLQDCMKGAKFVQESVFEKVEVKREVSLCFALVTRYLFFNLMCFGLLMILAYLTCPSDKPTL